MRAAFLLLLILLGVVSPAMAQGSSGVTARQVLDRHAAWNSQENLAGATLTLKQVGRQGNTISFQLIAKGLPRDRAYQLISLPIASNNTVTLERGITINAAGQAICSGKTGECGSAKRKDAPVTVRLAVAPGEPLRLGLVAMDDPKVGALVNETPRPLRGSDGNCRVEAVLLEPRASMLRVTVTGMRARSPFVLTSESGGKVTTLNVTADMQGSYSAGLMPTRSMADVGTIEVKVNAPSCKPTVTVPWSVVR